MLKILDVKKRYLKKLINIVNQAALSVQIHQEFQYEAMAEGRSEDFQKHFLGTHFFNPPRYLKLLEVIPTKYTAPEVFSS